MRQRMIPSMLEPPGLLRSYGKRPDGVTVVPWKCGKLLVWVATCPDTFSLSYSSHVAALAKERKCTKYTSLAATHAFTPVAIIIETSGAIGPMSLEFLKELGRRVRRHTGDEQAALSTKNIGSHLTRECRFYSNYYYCYYYY